MAEIVKKQVCKCTNCGNEAEMTVTCTLAADNENPGETKNPDPPPKAVKKVKGTATCTHCGSEADMWIDI